MSLPMEDGKYLARACGAAQFEESGNGNMQIAVPFEVVDDPEFTGEVITWFATMHGTPDKKGKTGKERVIESLLYMGFQGDDLTALMEISDDEARALMPEIVEIVVGVEPANEYHDSDRLKVKWVNRPGAGRASFKQPLSKEGMRSFASQMKASLRNARGGSGGTRPASKPAPSRPNGSQQKQKPSEPEAGFDGEPVDDIPF